jgi:hypothetical protein
MSCLTAPSVVDHVDTPRLGQDGRYQSVNRASICDIAGQHGHTRGAINDRATASAEDSEACAVFLAGMGLINPIGTAMALEPFGDRAGIASALLGFLQMACAAIGTAPISVTPGATATAFSWVALGGTICAAAVFFPVWRRPRLQSSA